MLGQDAQIIVDGQLVDLAMTPLDPLLRAVIISLFTWRRAAPGDTAVGETRWGWWGDSYAEKCIGSRLYLLARQKMLPETLARAKEYAAEALAWLVEDGVATDCAVTVERNGIDRLDLWVVITRADGETLDLRFNDLWKALHV